MSRSFKREAAAGDTAVYAAVATAHDAGMSPAPVVPFAPLRFAVAYFGAVFVAGVVLGVVRTLWLAPAVGPVAAVAIELPLMLAFSALMAARLLRRWPLSRGPAALAGAIALLLLLAAEVGVSLLAGRDLAAHWALYRSLEAQLGLVGQVVFGALPALRVKSKAPQ
jgi:hypothetical protein